MGWRYRRFRRFRPKRKRFRRVRKAVKLALLPFRGAVKFGKIMTAAWRAKHGPTV